MTQNKTSLYGLKFASYLSILGGLMKLKSLLFVLSSLGVMIAFQNCGKALEVSVPEVMSEQRQMVSNALKPSTKWHLQKVESQNQAVTLPKSYSVVLNFIELPATPDLMCIGGCSQQYHLSLATNCLIGEGRYSISFDMKNGVNQHLMSFESINKRELCEAPWDNWVLRTLEDPELQTQVSHESDFDVLIIHSGHYKLTFFKAK